MKKIIAIGLTFVAVLAMVGCGSDENVTAEDLNKTAVAELDKQKDWNYTTVESNESTMDITKEVAAARDVELTSLKSETVYAISVGSDIKVLTIVEITDEKERKAYEEFISGENSGYYVASKGNFVVTSVEDSGEELSAIVKKMCK